MIGWTIAALILSAIASLVIVVTDIRYKIPRITSVRRALILVPVALILLFFYMHNRSEKIKVERTLSEMNQIKETVEDWKNTFNSYPSDLYLIKKGRPLRHDWATDEWEQTYSYELTKNKSSFLIISSGSDKLFGTYDDLIVK